jgi:hypothetical protein
MEPYGIFYSHFIDCEARMNPLSFSAASRAISEDDDKYGMRMSIVKGNRSTWRRSAPVPHG